MQHSSNKSDLHSSLKTDECMIRPPSWAAAHGDVTVLNSLNLGNLVVEAADKQHVELTEDCHVLV
jgi:hypothetical protein